MVLKVCNLNTSIVKLREIFVSVLELLKVRFHSGSRDFVDSTTFCRREGVGLESRQL